MGMDVWAVDGATATPPPRHLNGWVRWGKARFLKFEFHLESTRRSD